MIWSAEEIFEALVDQFQIARRIFLHGICPSGNDYPNFCSFHINYRTFSHVFASCDIFVHTFANFGIWFILWQMHTSKNWISWIQKTASYSEFSATKIGHRSKQPKTRSSQPSPLAWNWQCRIMWMDFPFWFQFNIL